MRVLLINSPYRFPDMTVHRSELLGLEYLASSIFKAGYEVSIYDPTMVNPIKEKSGLYYYGTGDEDMYNKIKNFHPDCVGISCHYSFASKESYNIAKIVKKIDPHITVVIGGLFVSVFNEKALVECDEIDYALIGEGEISFLELLEYLSGKNANITSIDGLIYRTAQEILQNKKSKFINNLDLLPFPGRDMIDIKPYMEGSKIKRLYGLGNKPALSLLTSRSCPNRCSFCNMWLVQGTHWRPRTADNVIEEIDEIVNKYRAEHIFIMDDNFTFNIDRIKIICERIIKKGYKFRWNTPNGISVKFIDDEMVSLMKQSGCANVCIAIESGSEYIRRKIMNKQISNNEIRNAVRCFKKADIPVVGFVIVGMPEEDEKNYNESFNFITSLPLTSIVVSFAISFPGTKLYEYLIKEGIIDSNFSIDMDDLNTPLYATEFFTKEDLIKRKQKLKDFFSGLGILAEIEAKNDITS